MVFLALMPVACIASYIYIRDKYEEEPWRLLLVGMYTGFLLSPIIGQLELVLMKYLPMGYMENLYLAFVVAALMEEGLKFAALYFLTMHNPELNEPFDGIVYATFISLGFAGVENYLYVLHPSLGGFQTAIYRGIFSVPGHGLFGVIMGYYFAMGKLYPINRKRHLFLGFILPLLVHGVYNFLLLMGWDFSIVLFYFFVLGLLLWGLKQMEMHSIRSPFK